MRCRSRRAIGTCRVCCRSWSVLSEIDQCDARPLVCPHSFLWSGWRGVPPSTCECDGIATAIQHPSLAVNIQTIGGRAAIYIGRTAQSTKKRRAQAPRSSAHKCADVGLSSAKLLGRSGEVVGDGVARRADARRDVEFVVNRAQMLTDGPLANGEALGNFRVRQAARDESKHL